MQPTPLPKQQQQQEAHGPHYSSKLRKTMLYHNIDKEKNNHEVNRTYLKTKTKQKT